MVWRVSGVGRALRFVLILVIMCLVLLGLWRGLLTVLSLVLCGSVLICVRLVCHLVLGAVLGRSRTLLV